jgi:methionyl-tRNA formyltransferase
VGVLAGEEVRIVAGVPGAAVVPGGAEPGTLLAAGQHAVDVATRQGVYSVHEVQPAGRRLMDAAAYLRGRRLTLPALPVAG